MASARRLRESVAWRGLVVSGTDCMAAGVLREGGSYHVGRLTELWVVREDSGIGRVSL